MNLKLDENIEYANVSAGAPINLNICRFGWSKLVKFLSGGLGGELKLTFDIEYIFSNFTCIYKHICYFVHINIYAIFINM